MAPVSDLGKDGSSETRCISIVLWKGALWSPSILSWPFELQLCIWHSRGFLTRCFGPGVPSAKCSQPAYQMWYDACSFCGASAERRAEREFTTGQFAGGSCRKVRESMQRLFFPAIWSNVQALIWDHLRMPMPVMPDLFPIFDSFWFHSSDFSWFFSSEKVTMPQLLCAACVEYINTTKKGNPQKGSERFELRVSVSFCSLGLFYINVLFHHVSLFSWYPMVSPFDVAFLSLDPHSLAYFWCPGWAQPSKPFDGSGWDYTNGTSFVWSDMENRRTVAVWSLSSTFIHVHSLSTS